MTYHGGAADGTEKRLIDDHEELDHGRQRRADEQEDVGDGQRDEIAVSRRAHAPRSPDDKNHHQIADQTDDEDDRDEAESDDLVERIVVVWLGRVRGVADGERFGNRRRALRRHRPLRQFNLYLRPSSTL